MQELELNNNKNYFRKTEMKTKTKIMSEIEKLELTCNGVVVVFPYPHIKQQIGDGNCL